MGEMADFALGHMMDIDEAQQSEAWEDFEQQFAMSEADGKGYDPVFTGHPTKTRPKPDQKPTK